MTRVPSTRVDPYDARLHYATTPDQWTALDRRFHLERPDPPNSMGETSQVTDTRLGRAHVIVWVDLPTHREHLTPAALLSTVVHEAYHAACGLLDHLGQDLDGSSEAAAYLVDWTATWLVGHTPGLDVRWAG